MEERRLWTNHWHVGERTSWELLNGNVLLTLHGISATHGVPVRMWSWPLGSQQTDLVTRWQLTVVDSFLREVMRFGRFEVKERGWGSGDGVCWWCSLIVSHWSAGCRIHSRWSVAVEEVRDRIEAGRAGEHLREERRLVSSCCLRLRGNSSSGDCRMVAGVVVLGWWRITLKR